MKMGNFNCFIIIRAEMNTKQPPKEVFLKLKQYHDLNFSRLHYRKGFQYHPMLKNIALCLQINTYLKNAVIFDQSLSSVNVELNDESDTDGD